MRLPVAPLAFCAALLAAPAPAQQIDLVGTWACSHAEFGPGLPETGRESVFNMALYRDGSWASSGRFHDGAPYQGRGTWRFGRNTTGGMMVTVEGQLTQGVKLPEVFSFKADLDGPDAFSRVTKFYTNTTAVDCARM